MDHDPARFVKERFEGDGLPAMPNPADRGAGRVVVTGAAGFIASHLVDALLESGHEVVAVDRRSVHDDALAALNLSRALDHDRLRLYRADLADDDLDALVAGADTVFHLAGLPGVRASWGARFADYVTANVRTTNRLLDACERTRVRRLVLASSSSIYGTTDRPSRECDQPRPASPYGVTKLAAEHLCLAHTGRADTALTVAVLRYFTVYGPRQRPGMAIGRVLLAALTGADMPVFGDGRQRRAYTYVDDVVAATIAAGTADLAAAMINIAGPASVSLREIVDLAQAVTGRPVGILPGTPQAGDVSATDADLRTARRLLRYRPTVGLHGGMARQAEWLAALPRPVLMSLLPGSAEIASCSR